MEILNRRKFISTLVLATAGAAVGLRACEADPALTYSYDDSKGFISKISISESNSPKNIQLTWSPNSDKNSVIIDRQVYVEPVEGNYDSILIDVSSMNGQIPQVIEARGTILQEDNKKQALLEITHAWEDLVSKNIENKDDRSRAVGEFVSKYLPNIKGKIFS